MADIFVSYTSSDRDWANWIALELEKLGHVAHVHEWEIKGGHDIYGWMEKRHNEADRVLCVVSDAYLKAPYSTLERSAALWQAAAKRPCFVLLVAVKPCRLPTLSDHFRRCELFGIPEGAARLRFRQFMHAPVKPGTVAFPGRVFAVSNIPIRVPEHFLGRDDALAAIDAALKRDEGRVAITALHGLRGVGKTTLAAAYAERHRNDYRATWWIRAETESTTRADLVSLGVRLGWADADEKEEPALEKVRERLRHEGDGLLLIYDNAIDAPSVRPYLPIGGAARVMLTSNAHNWRRIAAPVEIRVWAKDVGADYLIARTGREKERAAAEALSEALGGLPLAHEQAAAYCERLDVSLAEYAPAGNDSGEIAGCGKGRAGRVSRPSDGRQNLRYRHRRSREAASCRRAADRPCSAARRPSRSLCSCSPRGGKNLAGRWLRSSRTTDSRRLWRRCALLRSSIARRSWTSATRRS